MGDRYLLNCEAREWKSGDSRSGHLLISAKAWLEEERELCKFGEENFGLMELDDSALISSIFVSIFVLIISSCYFISVSILLILAVLSLARQV